MSKRLVKIGEAAQLLGTTPDTLRKWGIDVPIFSGGQILEKPREWIEAAKVL